MANPAPQNITNSQNEQKESKDHQSSSTSQAINSTFQNILNVYFH